MERDRVALDSADLFQLGNAIVRGAARQVDIPRERDEASAGIFLQRFQQSAVFVVQIEDVSLPVRQLGWPDNILFHRHHAGSFSAIAQHIYASQPKEASMELGTFIIFAITTLVVVFTPGPAAIAVTAQGAANGVRRAQFGIAGVASANAIYFALSAVGIAAAIIASDWLFAVIKWTGVAYLTYLGLSALLSKAGALSVAQVEPQARTILFAKGFVVEFANPKALLYFAAVLPQFLTVSAPIAPQILIMGLATVILDFAIYSVYAALGQTIARSGVKPWVIKSLNRVAGAALLIAAFRIARVSG